MHLHQYLQVTLKNWPM